LIQKYDDVNCSCINIFIGLLFDQVKNLKKINLLASTKSNPVLPWIETV